MADEMGSETEWCAVVEDEFRARYSPRYEETRRWFLQTLGWQKETLWESTKLPGRNQWISPLFTLFKLVVDFSLSVPYAPTADETDESVPSWRFGNAILHVSRMDKETALELVVTLIKDPCESYRLLDGMRGNARDSWASLSDWREWLDKVYETTHDPIAWVRSKALAMKMDCYRYHILLPALDQIHLLGPPFGPLIGEEKGHAHDMPFAMKAFRERRDRYNGRIRYLSELARKNGLLEKAQQGIDISRLEIAVG